MLVWIRIAACSSGPFAKNCISNSICLSRYAFCAIKALSFLDLRTGNFPLGCFLSLLLLVLDEGREGRRTPLLPREPDGVEGCDVATPLSSTCKSGNGDGVLFFLFGSSSSAGALWPFERAGFTFGLLV
jgi:hypothetical protein